MLGSYPSMTSFEDLQSDDISDFSLPTNVVPKEDTFLMLDSVSVDGEKKIVNLSHYNVITNIVQLTVKKTMDIKPGDLCLAPIPYNEPIGIILGLIFPTVSIIYNTS